MDVDRIVVGPLKENCYVLTINNSCIIIDPGDEYDKIKKVINNKKIVCVLITHRHFDHIGALSNFDQHLVFDYKKLEEKEYRIDKFKFEIIYTKGHKEDCVTIYFKQYNIMFTGDFIFKGAIGRTDLNGGNIFQMKKSLEKIKLYDDSIKIYPGHGETSILGYEKNNFNYYI